jgi:hypothetical protein
VSSQQDSHTSSARRPASRENHVIIGRWHLYIFPLGWFLIVLLALLVLALIGWFAFRISN